MTKENTAHKNLPSDFPVYHAENNLFFCRYSSGTIHIAKFASEVVWEEIHRFFNSGGFGLQPIFDVRITPNQWISIIAEMSFPKAVNKNHNVAQKLHLG